MALTYLDSTVKSEGDTWTVIANMLPDTSYVSGGYYIDPVQVRLTRIQDVIVPNNLDGYAYDFDKTTGKLKISSGSGGTGVIAGAPLAPHTHGLANMVDEVVAVDPLTGLSAPVTVFPVGSVTNVYITGGVSGVAQIIPGSATLASGQVQINYATGVLTFLIADAVTSATITYSSVTTTPVSGGTPSGTVTVTPSAFTEIANGTDVRAIIPNINAIITGW